MDKVSLIYGQSVIFPVEPPVVIFILTIMIISFTLTSRVDYNPYTDFTTHKINQILVETGFSPEWVQLQKDIRQEKEKLRGEMTRVRQSLGPAPLPPAQQEVWTSFCERLRGDEVRTINKMIEKFNLIVPNMNNQMFQYKFETDVEKIFNMTIKQKTPNIKETDSAIKEGNNRKARGFLLELFNSFNK